MKRSSMPVICAFWGIAIKMFYREHGIPHFHAEYNEYKISVSIQTGEVIDGKFPVPELK